MYLSFYGFKRKPFQVSTNTDFLWLGKKQKQTLVSLKYGVLENQGFLVLTGDVGTGKTTLINGLTNSLADTVIVAKIPDPGLETIDFMNYIAHAFEIDGNFSHKGTFLIYFSHFLKNTHAAGKKVLLIIDESQRLSSDMLEEIRQLSNIEHQGTKLLNILFVGQSTFNDVLLENKNRALHQRITTNYVIAPLDVAETEAFIKHRLTVAGASWEIFSRDGIRSVYELSSGLPRRINIICDHALLSGYAWRRKTITREIVQRCVKDLYLPNSRESFNVKTLRNSYNSDCKTSTDIPSVHSGRRGSPSAEPSPAAKIFGTVFLIIVAVLIVTFINYPQEYYRLLYRFKNSEMQVSSIIQETNSSTAAEYSEPYKGSGLIEPPDTMTELQFSADIPLYMPAGKRVLVKVESDWRATQGKNMTEGDDIGAADEFPKKKREHDIVKTAGVPVPDEQLLHTIQASPDIIVPEDRNSATLLESTDEYSTTDETLLRHPIRNTLPAEEKSKPEFVGVFLASPPHFQKQLTLIEEVLCNILNSAGIRVMASSESSQVGDASQKTIGIEQQQPTDLTAAKAPKTTVAAVIDTGGSVAETVPAVYSERGEYMMQPTDAGLPDQLIEPAEPVETEQVEQKEADAVDPGAVIDWIIKNRSK
ncbi:MAG: AAA family ATPase [Desulforhopalus sp.]